jgi:serine/threonine protein kinase
VGEVYEAEAVGGDGGSVATRVAVKVLDREWAKDPVVAGRFAREAAAAGDVKSEHVVRVMDGGTADGCPYIVMELLDGEDLGKRLGRERRLAVGEALGLVEGILEGLVAAHAAGVVHRDLKPDNVILVRGEGASAGSGSFVKIVDFGMFKAVRPAGSTATAPLALTTRGTVVGTPLYLSPEQARAAEDVDGRADVFAVGAILFECLTGRPPFTGETEEEILVRICMEDAPDLRTWAPEVSADVARVVAKALRREREKRFASAGEMLDAVRRVGVGVGVEEVRRLRRRARTRLVVAAVIATLAGAVVTLLGVALAGR